MSWETLDVAALLAARASQYEDTTSANVGSYVVPIGGMLRRQVPGMPPADLGKCSGDGECPLDHHAWAELYGRR